MTVIVKDSQQMEFSEYCSLLWREREIVEQVLFRIVEQQLVLKAGQTRWLAAANNEVETALEDLRISEVLRSAEADNLTSRMSLPTGSTLSELAEVAPEPWASILLEHRDALRALAAEIQVTTEENMALLGAGGRAVRETLLSLNGTVASYSATGDPTVVGRRFSRVDHQA